MLNILFIVLKRKKYAIIAGVVAIVFVGISYYLTVNNVYKNSIVIFSQMNGVSFTVITLILGSVIAVLIGSHIALIIFRRDIIKSKTVGNKVSGAGGAVVGILASGCPSCGVPLLGLIGLPLGLAALPFKGIELKVLSIIFLSLAIFLVSKSIRKNMVCQ